MAADGGLPGIDKVRLSVRARPAFDEWKRWGCNPKSPVMKLVLTLAAGVPVSVDCRRVEGGWRISVEFNPSRVLDPEGWGLCPLSRFPEAWEAVLGEVACLIGDGEDELLGWDVRMVHLARDFSGVDANFVLRGLVPVRPPYAKVKDVYFSIGPVALAETLYVGNGQGKAKLYDKHAQTRGVAPEGTVRFELSARGAWLERAGILYAHDLSDEELVGAFFRERWAWSGFGSAVLAAPAAFAVLNDPAIPLIQRLEFFALFAADAHGQPPFPGCSQAALKRYERQKRKLGIVPSVDAFCAGPDARTVRLDLDLGREVWLP